MLVERRVAVIAADPRGANAARAATNTLPIVFMTAADPVKNGMVPRLDRPGGNLTGVTILASDLNAKRFGLFRELVPQATLIGVLTDSTNVQAASNLEQVQEAASRLGVPIKPISAGKEGEIDAAFAAFAHEGVGAVFVVNGFLFFSLSDRLSQLSIHYRMPLSGELRKFVDGGALMSYGPSLTEAYRQVGIYTGRILKGEKPGDLPVRYRPSSSSSSISRPPKRSA
jgi:putative ABC transport system substrate-binding protein